MLAPAFTTRGARKWRVVGQVIDLPLHDDAEGRSTTCPTRLNRRLNKICRINGDGVFAEDNPINIHLIQEALQFYQDGHYEAAIDVFQQIGGADGAYGEADCQYRLGRSDEAREALNRCLALDPDHEYALALIEAMSGAPSVDGDLAETSADAPQCLSRRRNRPFVGVCAYPTMASLNAALQAAKDAFPVVDSAYKTSNKTSILATPALLLVTPLVLAFLVVLCGSLCLAWAYIDHCLHDSSSWLHMGKPEVAAGWASLVLDVVLVCLIATVPGFGFRWACRLLKNRKPWLPSLLSALVAVTVSALLFLPWIEGVTLAPTGIAFASISIRWVLIVAALVVGPITAAIYAHDRIADQRFCEVTGRLLSPVRTLHIAFDYAENALDHLLTGNYLDLVDLPRCGTEQRGDHYAQVMFWWNQRAGTALLEMKVFFRSVVFKSINEESAKSEQWLAFSTLLDRVTAERLHVMYSDPGREGH